MNGRANVTVVVPTKNSARTLEACLSSIRAQAVPVELIVVDNGSTDCTREIAARHADLVLAHGPERSAQRNEGARRAAGDFLAMIDSDMRLAPGVIGACLSAAGSESDVSGVVIPEESVGEGFWAECKRLERSFYDGVPWMEAARFFRKRTFQEAGGYDESQVSGEDWDLTRRLGERGRIVRVNALIQHDEGRLTLSETIRKKWYYASRFGAYADAAHGETAFSRQTGIVSRYGLYFSDVKRLFARPKVGLGMLFMKTCEFGAGSAGYIFGRIKNQE